jgi:hypothetical protein
MTGSRCAGTGGSDFKPNVEKIACERRADETFSPPISREAWTTPESISVAGAHSNCLALMEIGSSAVAHVEAATPAEVTARAAASHAMLRRLVPRAEAFDRSMMLNLPYPWFTLLNTLGPARFAWPIWLHTEASAWLAPLVGLWSGATGDGWWNSAFAAGMRNRGTRRQSSAWMIVSGGAAIGIEEM